MPPNDQAPPVTYTRMVRPDGTTVDATPEQASRLELLGYKPEAVEARASRMTEAGREEFYSSTPQQFAAGGKALLRGASLGATDLLFDEDATRAQQQYNPGLSMGLEIVGGVAPMFLSGGTSAGAQIAARTPAALAARAGTAVAEATGLGRYGKAAVALGVEGGIVGAAAEADRAYLADDELTAEAVFHGLGFGAVFGAGTGVLGAKFISAGENAASRLAGKADNAVVDAEFRMVDDGVTLLPRGEGPPAGARQLAGEVPVEGRYGGPPDAPMLPGRSPSNRPINPENGTFYAEGVPEYQPKRQLQLTAGPEATGPADAFGNPTPRYEDLLESARPDAITPSRLEFAKKAAAAAAEAEAAATASLEAARAFRAGTTSVAGREVNNYEILAGKWDAAVSGVRKKAANAEAEHYATALAAEEARAAAKGAADKLATYISPSSQGARAVEPSFQAFSTEVRNVAGRFAEVNAAAENVMAMTHSKLMAVKAADIPGLAPTKLALIRSRLSTAFDGIKQAGIEGSPALKQKALAAYTEAMQTAAEAMGISTKAATTMLDMVATVGEAGRVLKGFPTSADAFAKLTPAKAEQLFGAIEATKKADLYPELTQAIDSAATSFAQAAGIRATGTEGLRSSWEALRTAAKAEKKAIQTGAAKQVSDRTRKRVEKEAAEAAKAAADAEALAANTKLTADKLRAQFEDISTKAAKQRAADAAAWEKASLKAQEDAAKALKTAEEKLKKAQEAAAKMEAKAAEAEAKAARAAEERAAKAAEAKAQRETGKAETKAQAREREAARQAESKARWEATNARKEAQGQAKAAANEEKAARDAKEKAERLAEAEARRAEAKARQEANDAYTQERRADQAQRRADADSYRQERRADQAERQADRDAARAEREADRAARQAERDAERAGRAPGFIGAVGAVAGHATMGGYTGAMAGRAAANSVWEALAALKLRGISRLNQAAASYFPKAGKAVTLVGPKIEPLSRKLDGTTETAKKSREALAADRLKELWGAYGAINDTLYEGVTQLSGDQPALMSKMHALGTNAFRELLRGTPRDPGTVSGLKSIWNPSPLQAMRLGRQLEVFHDPIGEFEKMLSTGSFDPIGIKMLRAAAPALYQEGRSLMLARLGEGNLLESMSYPDQIALGTMLELDIHSSMRPEHIASSQALHQARKEPMEMPIKPQGGAGGRPPSGSSDATSAQQITAH